MRRCRLASLIALLGLFVVATSAGAQSVTGKVLSNSNAAIVGVSVQLLNTTGGFVTSAAAASDGAKNTPFIQPTQDSGHPDAGRARSV